MELENCKSCEYRKQVARLFDIHIDWMDCWKTDCPYMKKQTELRDSLLNTQTEK